MNEELKKARQRLKDARFKQKAKLAKAKSEARAAIREARKEAEKARASFADFPTFEDQMDDIHDLVSSLQGDIAHMIQPHLKRKRPRARANKAVARKVFDSSEGKKAKETKSVPEAYNQDYRGNGMVEHIKKLEEDNRALKAKLEKAESTYVGKRGVLFAIAVIAIVAVVVFLMLLVI